MGMKKCTKHSNLKYLGRFSSSDARKYGLNG